MSFFGKLAFWKKNEDEFSAVGLGSGNNFSSQDLSLGRDFGAGKPEDLNLEVDQFSSSAGLNPYQQQMPQQPFTQPQFSQPNFSQPPQQPGVQYGSPQGYTIAKDIEIISSKLDALRAGLESISQRLANIERIAYGEQEQHKRRNW